MSGGAVVDVRSRLVTPALFVARIGRVTFNALPGESPRVAPHFAAGRARGWLYMARGISARRPGDPESVDPTACAEAPEPTAKGCHGCRFAHGLTCSAAFASSVQTWQAQHLQPDLLTPKPNAPECPGRVER